MWIKICGNTNLADAEASAEAGANALGFIFAASKRQITAERAREIIAKLPPSVEKIGVFVNADPDVVANTVADCGLSGVQLHGEEDAVYIRRLHAQIPEIKIIKAMPYSAELAESAKHLEAMQPLRAILVDSAARGGTGVAFNWESAREVFLTASAHMKLILAGGLDPANVGNAIDSLAPWGVDVVSGVESAPGKKDHEKLKRFIAEVRKARRQETLRLTRQDSHRKP